MKRALVTGGNRGIGFAIAKGLIAAGLEVVVGARNPQSGETAAAALGAAASFVELDVADSNSIDEAMAQLAQSPIDVLVNNAGVLRSSELLEDVDGFDEAMAVMVRGPFLLMHHVVPHMVSRGYGRVVNVSSGWGAFSDGVSGPGAYGVAKAALNALTVASARTLPQSVKVNAMCPGWVKTRMGGTGADRSPEEGAATAIWLATLDEGGPTGGFFRDQKPIAF